MKFVGAVRNNAQTSCATRSSPQGSPLALRAIHLVSRLRRVVDMCSSRISGIAYRLSNGRTLCAPTEEKNPLPFSLSKRSPVSGLRQTILEKGRFTRGWKPWCLPSCAPAGQARFRPLRKRSTIVWQRLTNNTDNRNFEKAKEEGENLPLSFTFFRNSGRRRRASRR